MTGEKPKPKQLLGPITTGAESVMNQSASLLKVREKSCVQAVFGYGSASHWL